MVTCRCREVGRECVAKKRYKIMTKTNYTFCNLIVNMMSEIA